MDAERVAARRLKSLRYDFHNFSLPNFIAWVEKAHGRKILTFDWKMSPGLFGAWFSDGERPAEYIFYRKNVDRIHQIHIQLHELAHILLGHPTLKITKDILSESWAGKTDLPFIGLALLRSDQINRLEIEAETLTNLIQEQVIRHTELRRLTEGGSSNLDIAMYLHDLGMLE